MRYCANLRCPDDAIFHLVAPLDDLPNCPLLFAWIGHVENCVVDVGVEGIAYLAEFLDALLGERLDQPAVGHMYALHQRLEACLGVGRHSGILARCRFQREFEVVCYIQKRFGETHSRICLEYYVG